MAAEHSQHAPVRLLIAESSENAAQEIDSLLRDAGIATRLRLSDLERAGDDLPTADLMICNAALPLLDQRLPQLRLKAPHVPIILVDPAGGHLSPAEALRLGAVDLVPRQEAERLVLVFKRELLHVCQGQRLSELNRALREAEQRCHLLLASSEAAIAYVHEGMHIFANAGYLELFGFADVDDLLGLPLMDLISEDGTDALKQELKRFRQDGETRTFRFFGRSTAGNEVAGSMTLARADYEGEPCLQVTVRTDEPVDESRDEAQAPAPESRINGSARHNGQASLVGVDAFLSAATVLVDSVEPHRVVLVAQIDGFTKLQETAGLRRAEALSRQVFDLLAEHLPGRPCFHLSTHQFAFASCDEDRADVLARAEVLRKAVETALFEIDGRTVPATISIGGAELDNDSGDAAASLVEAALDTAFAAAARAEAAGGNRIDVLTKEVAREEPDSDAAKTLAQINDAIDNQRLLLLFQPIISLRGDSDEHYEVFLRMVDRDGSHIAPNEFLRTAIEHGVAGKLDRWVILQSIKMLSAHRAKGHSTRLTINLTANSVIDPEFLQWLGVAIKAARLPSDAVIFQITERDATDQVRQTREFIEGLKAMHCRTALSRFGLADNPMELLGHLPVDFVKLDGSMVDQVLDDADHRQELADLIKTLQGYGKLTVIPMVESAGVLSALWQAGANYIQGHYLQEPSAEMNFDFSTDD
jgi:multidomain signaling protein FimX